MFYLSIFINSTQVALQKDFRWLDIRSVNGESKSYCKICRIKPFRLDRDRLTKHAASAGHTKAVKHVRQLLIFLCVCRVFTLF